VTQHYCVKCRRLQPTNEVRIERVDGKVTARFGCAVCGQFLYSEVLSKDDDGA